MDFSSMTNIRELLAAGGPILIILILLSVYSISVILERYFRIRKAINYSRRLIAYSRTPLQSGSYTKVEEACRKESVKNTPAGVLLSRLCKERKRSRQDIEKIAESVIDFETVKLRTRDKAWSFPDSRSS